MIRTKNVLKIVVMLSLLSFLGAFGIGCGCFIEATVEAPVPAPVPAPVVKAPPAPAPAPVVKAPPAPPPPPPPPPPPAHKATPSPKVMVFDANVLFDFDKSSLTPRGKELIKAYLQKARAHLSRARNVIITGHTDNVGSPKYNMKLSLRRAEAVRNYLVSLGADSKKMKVIGKGETKPVASNRTKEGRAKNRRVEIEVIGLGK